MCRAYANIEVDRNQRAELRCYDLGQVYPFSPAKLSQVAAVVVIKHFELEEGQMLLLWKAEISHEAGECAGTREVEGGMEKKIS